MKSANIKWGILGPGRIAHKFAQALRDKHTGVLHAIASQSKNKGENFANEYHVPHCYSRYDDLINDRSVDAIYIASPHSFHFQQAKRCIEAGKPTLIEKPLTVNAREAEVLIDLAQKHRTFFMEGMWTLFTPIYKQVDQWLKEKQIGKLKLISSSFGYNIDKDPRDRWLNPELAGGVLLDMGVYSVATSQWFHQSNPVAIQAMGYLGETNVDELTMVSMKYSVDCFTQFNCNFHAKTENALYLYGEHGHIRINQFFDATRASLVTKTDNNDCFLPYDINGFEYQIREVEQGIREGRLESPLMTHQRSLETMRIMDAILKQIGINYPGY